MLISIHWAQKVCCSGIVHRGDRRCVTVVVPVVIAALWIVLGTSARAQTGTVIFRETFVDDPVSAGRALTSDPSQASRFVHTSDSQSLTAAYHSALPSAMLQWPLAPGRSLNQDDSFSYSVSFEILDDAQYFADSSGGLASISFGLVNTATTGHSRTGNPSDFRGNTFDMVTVDYFPNDHPNPSFDSITITPTVFQSQLPGSDDAFDGIQFPFAPESAIANNGEVGVLPRGQRLTVRLAYDSTSRTLTVTLDDDKGSLVINQFGAAGAAGGPDGDVHTIEHTLNTTTEFPRQSDALFPAVFSADAFGILLWQDGFDKQFSDDQASSLVANVRFDNVIVALVPEPTVLAAVVWMGFVCYWMSSRRFI